MRKSAKKSLQIEAIQETQVPGNGTTNPAILVGIDWADKEHAYCALLPNGKLKTGSFKQSKTGVDEWIAELEKLAPNCNIDVCIETSTGALINTLMEFDKVQIFPVNPLALANYRKAFAPGGGKNDPASQADYDRSSLAANPRPSMPIAGCTDPRSERIDQELRCRDQGTRKEAYGL